MKNRILEFIETQRFCVISTVDENGKPESALIGFSETPNLEIIFGTSNESRKYQNLLNNPCVAIEIGSGDPRITVQYEGIAEPFEQGVFENNGQSHIEKLPDSSKYVGRPDQIWFKVKPTWVRFTDSRTEHTEVHEMRQFS